MKERPRPPYEKKIQPSKNEVLQNDAANAPQRSTKTKSTSVLVGIIARGHVPSISMCILTTGANLERAALTSGFLTSIRADA